MDLEEAEEEQEWAASADGEDNFAAAGLDPRETKAEERAQAEKQPKGIPRRVYGLIQELFFNVAASELPIVADTHLLHAKSAAHGHAHVQLVHVLAENVR